MSRPSRAGTPGRPVTIRATNAERERWALTAGLSGCNLSEWARVVLNRKADEAEQAAPAGEWDKAIKRRRRKASR